MRVPREAVNAWYAVAEHRQQHPARQWCSIYLQSEQSVNKTSPLQWFIDLMARQLSGLEHRKLRVCLRALTPALRQDKGVLGESEAGRHSHTPGGRLACVWAKAKAWAAHDGLSQQGRKQRTDWSQIEFVRVSWYPLNVGGHCPSLQCPWGTI